MRCFLLLVMAGTLLNGAASVLSEPLDECGRLGEEGAGCVIFVPYEHHALYVTDLPSLVDSLAGVPVRVRGDVSDCQSACYPYYDYCISGTVATVCEPSDLGCGVLREDPVDYCHTWTSPVFGTLLTQMNGYSDGDTVRAVGIIDCLTPTTCNMGCILRNATFYDCLDTLSAVEHPTWGGLKSLFR
jgi:hypothetical protein